MKTFVHPALRTPHPFIVCAFDLIELPVVIAIICILAALLIPGLCSAQPWSQRSLPDAPLTTIACSADGIKLITAGHSYNDWSLNSSPIFTSSDAGVTWTQTAAPIGAWSSVASSADGTRLVAASGDARADLAGLIYSSQDSGVTWTPTSAPTKPWTSIASSASGSKLVAAFGLDSGDGSIYVSLNSGANWSHCAIPTNNWTAVASSADGSTLIAVAGGSDPVISGYYQNLGFVYTSHDSGATWTQTSAPSNTWNSAACSADGVHLIVASQLGGAYLSADSGASWTLASTPDAEWTSVASSEDGTKLAAVDYSLTFFSTNSGSSLSADGRKLIMEHYTWSYSSTPLPVLTISSSDRNLVVSWLVPSSTFVLQFNSDPYSASWTEMPFPPTLNVTNLHYETSIFPTNGQYFYRLKQQ